MFFWSFPGQLMWNFRMFGRFFLNWLCKCFKFVVRFWKDWNLGYPFHPCFLPSPLPSNLRRRLFSLSRAKSPGLFLHQRDRHSGVKTHTMTSLGHFKGEKIEWGNLRWRHEKRIQCLHTDTKGTCGSFAQGWVRFTRARLNTQVYHLLQVTSGTGCTGLYTVHVQSDMVFCTNLSQIHEKTVHYKNIQQ